MAAGTEPIGKRVIFRDLTSEELMAAWAELRRRIKVLTDSGVAEREAQLRVISQRTVPIVEGEPVADTAMRFGIMPERAPLSPDEIRQLLRECVTVVKPGETLVIRGYNWTPNQVREIQHAMDVLREDGRIPFRALAVFGDELAIAEPPA